MTHSIEKLKHVLDLNARVMTTTGIEFVKDAIKELEESQRDAERYRFLRDTDNWGEDSGNLAWDALTDASVSEFDKIIDTRMGLASDLLRGHPIVCRGGEWFYVDNNTPTEGNPRPCGRCNREDTPEGHDGCLGMLPGAMNACCGHGSTQEAYVQFSESVRVCGKEALAWIEALRADLQDILNKDRGNG